uniref:Uncharacterized protein n=1 Tax=Cyprinodon variegatus TaxID=28743 RepID=A0A3Q2DH99_CYPVA
MKCAWMFLVLSMVVMMAQPGEGFFGLLIHGITHAVHGIKKLIDGKENLAEQQAEEQLFKRLFEDKAARRRFD